MKTTKINYAMSHSGDHVAKAQIDGRWFAGHHVTYQMARGNLIRNIKRAGYKVKSGITALMAVRGG